MSNDITGNNGRVSPYYKCCKSCDNFSGITCGDFGNVAQGNDHSYLAVLHQLGPF